MEKRMKYEDDYGLNKDSNLSHNVRASNKEESQKTTTLTENKKERLRKRKIFNAWIDEPVIEPVDEHIDEHVDKSVH